MNVLGLDGLRDSGYCILLNKVPILLNKVAILSNTLAIILLAMSLGYHLGEKLRAILFAIWGCKP